MGRMKMKKRSSTTLLNTRSVLAVKSSSTSKSASRTLVAVPVGLRAVEVADVAKEAASVEIARVDTAEIVKVDSVGIAERGEGYRSERPVERGEGGGYRGGDRAERGAYRGNARGGNRGARGATFASRGAPAQRAAPKVDDEKDFPALG